ncbi:class I SAM-dependent methyltransferase [Kovacikia minuta CCNUW1]|uniref:class I SAM-dependent methyltransferase n=1 Tax=Kovacikia minuta TaxID=2931930 RepID=UPI001CC9E8A0|nr:methyltransferase domain-containing protein [Kovacikia minuta]UBF24117.1 class I SAM-dependent methyltransferase [Kovacikia minuta CCNUW1]
MLYGSELFSQGLNFAKQRLSRAELFQMNGCQIPFENEFDVIGAFDVLEHIKEDTVVLAEMYRAVSKGGGILLAVPQHRWLWSQKDEHARHVRRYLARELKLKVQNAGFKVVRITSFISLLLPLMLLSRLQLRHSTVEYDPIAELKIQGWLNATLENVLNIERKLIQLGVSFPIGGSLLLIAKKINE